MLLKSRNFWALALGLAAAGWCAPDARAAALFGLVGAVNLPIIHFSVQWWNTLHQGESIELTGTSIAPALLWPLPFTLLGFSCLFGAAVLLGMRAELASGRVEARLRRTALAAGASQ